MVFSTIICFVVGCSITADAKTLTLNKDNTIYLYGKMTKKSTTDATLQGQKLDSRLPSDNPLFLVLYSGGGHVSPSLKMIDSLNGLNRPVHTITVFSGSMAFHTVQNLKKRYLLRNGVLFTHQGLFYIRGTAPYGTLKEKFDSIYRLIWKMDSRVVKRSKGKLTIKSYQKLYKNDHRCYGTDCLKYGFADQVVNVRCDESLSGSREQLAGQRHIMGIHVKLMLIYSKCPLNTTHLGYQVYVDGKPMKKNSVKFANVNQIDDIELDLHEDIKKGVESMLKAINYKGEPVIYRTILK